MLPPSGSRPCPCGGPTSYAACCGPLLRGERQAGTAEELMRSRYAAHVAGDAAYLWRTWHPRTRPEQVVLDPATTWTGLEVLDADADRVHFRAGHQGGVLEEDSRFAQRAGRWFYVGPVEPS